MPAADVLALPAVVSRLLTYAATPRDLLRTSGGVRRAVCAVGCRERLEVNFEGLYLDDLQDPAYGAPRRELTVDGIARDLDFAAAIAMRTGSQLVLGLRWREEVEMIEQRRLDDWRAFDADLPTLRHLGLVATPARLSSLTCPVALQLSDPHAETDPEDDAVISVVIERLPELVGFACARHFPGGKLRPVLRSLASAGVRALRRVHLATEIEQDDACALYRALGQSQKLAELAVRWPSAPPSQACLIECIRACSATLRVLELERAHDEALEMDQAERLHAALARCASLRRLVLSDEGGNAPNPPWRAPWYSVALPAVEQLTQLVELALHRPVPVQEGPNTGVSVARLRRLRVLRVTDVALWNRGAGGVCALRDSLRACPRLESLQLPWLMDRSDKAEILASIPSLRTVI